MFVFSEELPRVFVSLSGVLMQLHKYESFAACLCESSVICSLWQNKDISQMRNRTVHKNVSCNTIPWVFFPAQTRNNFVSTKQEVEKLMKRIRSADQDYNPLGQWTMEGFLYVQEKRESLRLGSRPAAPPHRPPHASLLSARLCIHHHKHALSFSQASAQEII